MVQVWQHDTCLAKMQFSCRVAAFAVDGAGAPEAGEAARGDLYTLHADVLPASQRVRRHAAEKSKAVLHIGHRHYGAQLASLHHAQFLTWARTGV